MAAIGKQTSRGAEDAGTATAAPPRGEGTAESQAAAALAASHVSVRYGGVAALTDVSLEFRSGSIEAIIGPNGAGKSTLFDALSGACPPTSGHILVAGQDVTPRSAVWRARHGLRRTFQRQQTFGHLTVLENVLTAQEWRGGGGGLVGDLLGLPSRKRRQHERASRAREVLVTCGLDQLRDASAASLTIEASRMLELARCLVGDPTILLLDEPTSGMEQATIDRLGQILAAVRNGGACAIVLVEHNIPFVSQLSDNVTVLQLGKVIATGDWTTVRNSPEVAAAYLG